VLIPLLAFDKKGNRVGFGKGYYDKFLVHCKPTVLKVGLSFFDPVDEIEDIIGIDIPLDFCVTPKAIHFF
jgi:5-formyltetrahydrofolate cyclo-ligase